VRESRKMDGNFEMLNTSKSLFPLIPMIGPLNIHGLLKNIKQ
jgi:hypothetical protein